MMSKEQLDKIYDAEFYYLSKGFDVKQWSDYRTNFYPYQTKSNYYIDKLNCPNFKKDRLALLKVFINYAFKK
jgi:hypothetical protein